MAVSDERLREIAIKLAEAMDGGKKAAPVLKLVQPSSTTPAARHPSRMDSITRESHIRLISSLRRYYKPYGMDLIVNQALIGKGSLDQLSDDELVDLTRSIDRARECISDGISFEEAGLLRSQCA